MITTRFTDIVKANKGTLLTLVLIGYFFILTPDFASSSDKSIRDYKRKSKVASKTSIKFCRVYLKLFQDAIAKKKFKRKLRKLNKRCKRSLKGNRRKCRKDPDRDNLSNLLEEYHNTNSLSKDSDGDTLSDPDEICVYKTDPLNADSDNDGIPDNQDPDVQPPSGNDNGGNWKPDAGFCDTDGNAGPKSFGIPVEITGNKLSGQSLYDANCISCHPIANGYRGVGSNYSSVVNFLKLPVMNSVANLADNGQSVADLTVFLNDCPVQTPPAGGGGPSPTPTPVQSSTPTPVPAPSGPACSSISGYTTSFSAGQALYNSHCQSCHSSGSKGQALTHSALDTAIKSGIGGMNINLSAQEVADLVDYLNTCSVGAPTPTPTPSDPVARGQVVFQSYCSSCHNTGVAKESTSEIKEAYQEEKEMQGLTQPSSSEYSDLRAYGRSLGGDD